MELYRDELTKNWTLSPYSEWPILSNNWVQNGLGSTLQSHDRRIDIRELVEEINVKKIICSVFHFLHSPAILSIMATAFKDETAIFHPLPNPFPSSLLRLKIPSVIKTPMMKNATTMTIISQKIS